MATCSGLCLTSTSVLRSRNRQKSPTALRNLSRQVARAAGREQPSSSQESPQTVNPSSKSGPPVQDLDDEEFEGLLPEEDWTVRGGASDSLSSNTDLGQAIQNACDELGVLGSLEQESLTKANELLRKLGYKGSITEAEK